MSNLYNSSEYKEWLTTLKSKVRSTQLDAAVSVNRERIAFYWELGAGIVERQKQAAWGRGFLKHLSADLMDEFPDVKSFSYRNLRAVRQWYHFYLDGCSNLATACGQIDVSIFSEPTATDISKPIWPQPVAKLNFYIKAVNEQLKQADDVATIGILLCKSRDKLVAEYVLSDINKPIGVVSEYEQTRALPDDLKSSLPSIEEIEAELGHDLMNDDSGEYYEREQRSIIEKSSIGSCIS